MADYAAANNETLALQIITPSRLVADTEASIVTLPGSEGVFGVLPGHQPFITTMKPGVLEYEEGGMPYKLAVSGGLVEVTQDHVMALARTAERPEEIDLDRARQAKEERQRILDTMSREDEGWDHAERKLQRAEFRLEVGQGL